jgi:hypothetical protein
MPNLTIDIYNKSMTKRPKQGILLENYRAKVVKTFGIHKFFV